MFHQTPVRRAGSIQETDSWIHTLTGTGVERTGAEEDRKSFSTELPTCARDRRLPGMWEPTFFAISALVEEDNLFRKHKSPDVVAQLWRK
jgi:hypothetical protein